MVTLYRSAGGNWTSLSQKTTDASGRYAFGFSPVPSLHRIVESDPTGYASDRVVLPSGLTATVVDANTVEFMPPEASSVGPLLFYDRRLPTATPTATPTNTATPTQTATPTLTATPTATQTPTIPGIPRVWLPIIVNAWMD
mgnify:FL=1